MGVGEFYQDSSLLLTLLSVFLSPSSSLCGISQVSETLCETSLPVTSGSSCCSREILWRGRGEKWRRRRCVDPLLLSWGAAPTRLCSSSCMWYMADTLQAWAANHNGAVIRKYIVNRYSLYLYYIYCGLARSIAVVYTCGTVPPNGLGLLLTLVLCKLLWDKIPPCFCFACFASPSELSSSPNSGTHGLSDTSTSTCSLWMESTWQQSPAVWTSLPLAAPCLMSPFSIYPGTILLIPNIWNKEYFTNIILLQQVSDHVIK